MIAKVAVPLPIDTLFDYYIPQRLSNRIQIGMRVKIIFNHKFTIGYLVERSSKSKIKKLNPIVDIVDESPLLTSSSLALARKIKDYYICSLGEAIDIMIPNVLKKAKNIKLDFSSRPTLKNINKKPQMTYVQSFLSDASLNYFKEEVSKRMESKKRIIFVVPQISMAQEMNIFFSKINGIRVAVWFGKLPEKHMLNMWQDLASDRIDLIIGTRSCIFAPMNNLDLIIIQDEYDNSHKDDQAPYYHTVKVAQMRSELEKCDVILNSLVPSSETYKLLVDKKINFKSIGRTDNLSAIQFTRLNFRDKIDIMVESEIESALERKEKVLVFLDKKGFSTFIFCRKCKQALKCGRCSSNLRFDYYKKEIICPLCNFKTSSIDICPICNSSYIKFSGLGVEKLESNLKRVFPLAKIITLEELIKNNKQLKDYDIVVTTRKIINLPRLEFDVTVVWDLDTLLNVGDFKSAEETYQLLSKLICITTKKVIISSGINPDFYLLRTLKNINFREFYDAELKIRKTLNLPPYYRMGLISVRGIDKKHVESESEKIYYFIERFKQKNIKICYPYEFLHSRLRGKYYRYLLIKSKNIELLKRTFKKTLKKFKSNSLIVTTNLDPI